MHQVRRQSGLVWDILLLGCLFFVAFFFPLWGRGRGEGQTRQLNISKVPKLPTENTIIAMNQAL